MTEQCITCRTALDATQIALCSNCCDGLEAGEDFDAVTDVGDPMAPILLGAAIRYIEALLRDDEWRQQEAAVFIAAVRRR